MDFLHSAQQSANKSCHISCFIRLRPAASSHHSTSWQPWILSIFEAHFLFLRSLHTKPSRISECINRDNLNRRKQRIPFTTAVHPGPDSPGASWPVYCHGSKGWLLQSPVTNTWELREREGPSWIFLACFTRLIRPGKVNGNWFGFLIGNTELPSHDPRSLFSSHPLSPESRFCASLKCHPATFVAIKMASFFWSLNITPEQSIPIPLSLHPSSALKRESDTW